MLFSENGELKNALMVSSTTVRTYFSSVGSARRFSRLLHTWGRREREILWGPLHAHPLEGCQAPNYTPAQQDTPQAHAAPPTPTGGQTRAMSRVKFSKRVQMWLLV